MNHQTEGQSFDEFLDIQDKKEPNLISCNYCEESFDENIMETIIYKGTDCGYACPKCKAKLDQEEKEEIA